MIQTKNSADLSSLDYMQYIIAATLSSFEVGTWFYTSEEREGLRGKLEELYSNVDNPFVKGNKISDIGDPKNDLVRFCLSAHTLYGEKIGLTNWGFDHDYYIDPKLENVRNDFMNEAKEVLGKDNFNFFQEVGKKLIED